MSGMTTADTQAKMVADFARTLQVEHSKLVVLKVLPFEDAGTGGKAVFNIMLDDGVYLGNQSPVAAARFLVYLTENFNSAAAERGDDSTSIVCRFLTVEEAAEAVIQAPIETTLSRTTSTVAETACIEILLADFPDMRPMRTDLDRALGTAVQCQDTEAWRIVTLVLPERSDASCTSVRAEIRKLVKQGGSGGGGEQRSAAAVADLLMEQCKDPESRLRTSWPSITSASPWPPRVPPPLPMHSAAGLCMLCLSVFVSRNPCTTVYASGSNAHVRMYFRLGFILSLSPLFCYSFLFGHSSGFCRCIGDRRRVRLCCKRG